MERARGSGERRRQDVREERSARVAGRICPARGDGAGGGIEGRLGGGGRAPPPHPPPWGPDAERPPRAVRGLLGGGATPGASGPPPARPPRWPRGGARGRRTEPPA